MNGCHIKPEQFFNLIFGFESIVEQALENLNLGAGWNSIAGTTVPSGKIWKITHAHIVYTGTVPTEIMITVMGLAGNSELLRQPSPVSTRPYMWEGEIYLQAGDYIRAAVVGATAGNDLSTSYSGVQMTISQ